MVISSTSPVLTVPRDGEMQRPASSEAPSSACSISVIIPTLNEESHLSRCLPEGAGSRLREVIVADGGSRDGTAGLAERSGWIVCRSAPGRAKQMNAGARIATGNVLLFLHADTVLPPDFDSHISRILSRPGVSAGAFRLRIDGEGWRFRAIESMANFRSIWLHQPYGDQAIFLKSDVFCAAGGFPEIAIMEDLALVRRLKKIGRIEVAPVRVVTSARRWKRRGVWRTTLQNQLCLACYYLGVSPEQIHRIYYGDRPDH